MAVAATKAVVVAAAAIATSPRAMASTATRTAMRVRPRAPHRVRPRRPRRRPASTTWTTTFRSERMRGTRPRRKSWARDRESAGLFHVRRPRDRASRRSHLRLSAVDEELDAVDEAGGVRGEEHRGVGDLLGTTDAAERDARGEEVQQAL